jgi:hypothetical protein
VFAITLLYIILKEEEGGSAEGIFELLFGDLWRVRTEIVWNSDRNCLFYRQSYKLKENPCGKEVAVKFPELET